ncbi:MAG: hypothetical protein E7446_04490 [Ruminococcaceae bacterium]|nr:hypothetical protein [Oscillospiraceae bacterium]
MEWNDPNRNRSAYPDLPVGSISYNEFLQRNTALGSLKIQASRAQNALPTEGVRISVIGRFNDARVLFFDGVTDTDGLITGITLPAPPRSASLQSDGARRGALYQVFASHPDYEPDIYEAEIFEGITSILPVTLRLPQEVI